MCEWQIKSVFGETQTATSAIPRGPAGGDLGGEYADPTVVAVHVPDMSAPEGTQRLTLGPMAEGQLLQRLGDSIVGVEPPETDAGGDLAGEYPAPDVVALHVQDTAMPGGVRLTLGEVDAGQLLQRVGDALVGVDPAEGATGVAGGDLAGSYPEPEVVALHVEDLTIPGERQQLTLGTVDTGQLLQRAGNTLIGVDPPSGTLSGPAGGDLAENYPDPQVVALHESGGARLAAGVIDDGEILQRSGTSIVGVAPVVWGTDLVHASDGDTSVSFPPSGPDPATWNWVSVIELDVPAVPAGQLRRLDFSVDIGLETGSEWAMRIRDVDNNVTLAPPNNSDAFRARNANVSDEVTQSGFIIRAGGSPARRVAIQIASGETDSTVRGRLGNLLDYRIA